MPRVKIGPVHARKRKRVLKRARGFVGGPGTLYRVAKEFTRKADVYAYEHRRQKKRTFRSLWITRLNAALKARGLNVSVIDACVAYVTPPAVIAALWVVAFWVWRRWFVSDAACDEGKCEHCGYDLTANISGRCPECGTDLPTGSSAQGKSAHER